MSDQISRQAIAIVGMACRMPGADNTAEFWDLIRTGRQSFGPLPEHRLNRELLLDSERGRICKTYTDLGGLVSERPFDKQKNPISDELLEKLDTAHKVMLEVAADACRDAGYNPFNLSERNAGVYIGNTGGSEQIGDVVYSTIVEEGAHVLENVKAFQALGSQSAKYLQQVVEETRRRYPGRKIGEERELGALTTSALISELFGLDGPMMVVDAACASSLQAMSVGIRALREGSIDMAFVGGASYCKSDSLVLFSAAQSVSPTGSCPFHKQADGLVTAEGYVILILKTLEKAIADKDQIHAVISGIGVSSDGRGKSLWAPLKKGQILAVQRAYSLNNLDPRRVQYIEAHATSTQVGDATELQALSESINGLIGDQAPKIPIGSVKGNIGHTLETAGMAGIVKTVLCLKHKTIPPVVKGDQLSEEIDWSQCPFDVPFAPRLWPEHADGHPRRAAVNAFGIGGLNVHVVLDEYVPQHSAKLLPAVVAPSATACPEDDRAIAIIGMGCILPGAKTLQAFWDLLLSERDALSVAPTSRLRSDLSLSTKRNTWKITGNYGGFIQDYAYDWRKHKIPPKQIANANPLQFMLLDAADQALNNAGLNEKNIDSQNTAVVVGTCFGGDFSNQLQMGLRLPEFQRDLAEVLRKNQVPENKIAAIAAEYQERLFEKMPAMLDETGSFTSSTLASRITKAFNLMGGAMAIDAGLCSSLLSIQSAVDMLRQRDANVVVCAAGQRSMDVWVYESLSLGGLLAKDKPSAPFTSQANGIVPGEGCGVVVLKRLADARRDGNPIHAVIRGIGAAADDDLQKSLSKAVNRALRDADLPALAVEAVETQGVGLEPNDQAEYASICETYADSNLERKEPIQLGALRHQIGDLAGAAGMAAVIKAARSATEGQLPATIGFTKLSDEIGDGRHANLSPRTVKIPAYNPEGYRAIAVTSMHGRMAYELILDNGLPKPVKPAAPLNLNFANHKDNSKSVNSSFASLLKLAPQLSVHRFAGNSRADLLAQISNPSQPATRTNSGGEYRLNLLASSPDELSKKLRLASEALRTDQWKLCTEQGIFFKDPTHEKPRIAFLFPGQGSQYHGMFEKLAANFAPTNRALKYLNARMREAGYPTFAELAGSKATGLGSDVWQTQISMLLADYLALETIRSFGVEPEYITGHSYGEYPALFAAGVWELSQVIQATRGRCDAVANIRTAPSAMVSVLANRETTMRIVEQVAAEAWLCAENSPEQCVIGGTAESIELVMTYCTQHQITAKRLRVPCAFHTPLLERTHEPLRAELDKLELHLPQIPFLSATFARFLADPSDLRDSLVDQMSHPVEYVSVIRKLRALGINTFLEIGPSQVLTQLTRKILNSDPAVRCLPLDQADANSPEALIRMVLALETWGALEQPSGVPPQNQTTPPAVPTAATKPTPKFVDATEARRARMRAASRGTTPQKSPKLVPATTSSATQETPPIADSAANPSPTLANGRGANNKNHASEHQNGHELQHGHNGSSPNGHYLNGNSNGNGNGHSHGNGHSRLAHTNGHSENSFNGNQPERAPAQSKPAAHALPENWDETLAWLQTQAQVSGLRGQLAAQLDQPWNSLGIDTVEFISQLHDFFEMDESSLKKLAQSKNVRELCLLLCQLPGKSAWLKNEPAAKNQQNSAELAQFLVQFVVDQTGYPQEMVELDADLEADLGIDSIKKAQLFGEIGERFSLNADPNLSLDDFPTLQHVLRYIESVQSPNRRATTSSAKPAAPPPASRNQASSAKPKSSTADWSAGFDPSSLNKVENFSASSTATATSATALLAEPTVANDAQDEAEITAYLVNFVIDQTGYPAEMVDLDADLEADLGIDSIKKAQLFGEIGEQYSLSADPNLSLDDFPTLRHVANYITRVTVGHKQVSHQRATSSQPSPTLAPEPVKQSTRPAEPAAAQQRADQALSQGSDYADFLVQFVVEQTGYPEDMVELDADLEADLGIDSIKKAQLFGEIGEKFQLSADPNLSLDDFPTLRHVMEYLNAQRGSSAASSQAGASAAVAKSNLESNPIPAKNKPVTAQGSTELPSQASFNEGFRRGQAARLAIKNAINRHTQTAITAREVAQNVDRLAKQLLPQETAELDGIADGAGILVESLRALNFASQSLAVAEAEFTCDSTNGSLVLRGFCLGETEPLFVDSVSRQGGNCREWIVPGYLGCLAGVSEHGFAISVSLPAKSLLANQLPAAIIAKRVIRECVNVNQAQALLDASCWMPGAVIAMTDFAANTVTHWTTDANGKPSRATASEIPTCSKSEILTASAQKQLQQTAAARLSTASFHWFRLEVQESLAISHTGDQWQTAASSVNQTVITLPFAIPRLHVSNKAASTARALSPICFPSGNRITKRFVPCLVNVSRQNSTLRATTVNKVAILGQQQNCQALATSLRSQNYEVLLLSENANADQISNQIELLGACHLILSAIGEYQSTTSAAWLKQSEQTLEKAFIVSQQWLALQLRLGVLNQISLTALTNLGGTLGLAPAIANPLGGGLAGFSKAVRNEYPELRVKVIDISSTQLDSNAAKLLQAEWLSADNELEVGFTGDERFVIRYREPALPQTGTTLPQAGDQWVITGGARGITAEVARALAGRYGVHLNILGSTPLQESDSRWLSASEHELKIHKTELMMAAKSRGEDAISARKAFENRIEITKNLQLFRDAGIISNYFVCDVTDWNAIDATLASIRKRGPIRGIMHGAGFEAAAKFEKKKLPQVKRTIQVKAGGAAALIALTARDPLGWFIGFGSTSGRFGGLGQTDYSLANDLLAKQVSHLREQRPECRAATIHWHAWGEIGMAARPESKFALEAFGLKMMPPGEGIAYLMTEIDAGLPEREIVVTEDLFVPSHLRVAALPVKNVTDAPVIITDNVHSKATSKESITVQELQAVLVNFVVEQTGYPEDMVELDADLEADLGIDSIKKAQLFGEIGERFQLQADPNLSLDDFPTLRQVLEYVMAQVNPRPQVSVDVASSVAVAQTLPLNPQADLAASSQVTLGPLLEQVQQLTLQGHETVAVFDPQTDRFLTDHRRNGQPLLPGTFGWELLAEAAAVFTSTKAGIRLTNVSIENPLEFIDESPRMVRVICQPMGNRWQTQSLTEFKDRSGRIIDPKRVLMKGEVEFLDQLPECNIVLQKNPFPLNPMVYSEDRVMFHGHSLRTCISLMFQHGGGWAKLKNLGHSATAGTRRLDGWLLPAGMLDGAIVGCAVFSYLMCGQRIEIPQGVDELTLHRQPRDGESCLMQFRFRENNDRNSWYDFEIFGEDKTLVAVVRGLRLVNLGK